MCKTCNTTFTFHNIKNKTRNERKWFDLWVCEGYTLKQLNRVSKHNHKALKRIKAYWLGQTPPLSCCKIKEIKHIIFDGTYFKHQNCFAAIIDSQSQGILDCDYVTRENYQTAYQLFRRVAKQGINPKSITIDGLSCVLRAARDVWPTIKIQRCLVHIQRQGLSWLRRNPSTVAAKKLRTLLLMVTTIDTFANKQNFVCQFNNWNKTFAPFIEALDPKDKVYSDLQRTKSLIINALPDMFYYLDDKNIPSTTNKIESYFSRLKNIIKRHNGLLKQHRHSYLKWYVYLKNNNT